MIGFTPQFIHQDWVDGVDTVQAADDNVFNGRFHALESEFAVIVGDPMCGNGNHQYRERAATGRNDCRGRHLQLRTESRLPRLSDIGKQSFCVCQTYLVDLSTGAETTIGFSAHNDDTGKVTVTMRYRRDRWPLLIRRPLQSSSRRPPQDLGQENFLMEFVPVPAKAAPPV